MKTLAELKRLKQGDELQLVYSRFPWKNGVILPIKRKVKRVQTNAISFEPIPELKLLESWLYFPKAKDFQGTENGFNILENGEILLSYQGVTK